MSIFPVSSFCCSICTSCCWCCNLDPERIAIGENASSATNYFLLSAPFNTLSVKKSKRKKIDNFNYVSTGESLFFPQIHSWVCNFCSGWAHNFLPEFESSRLLPFSSGHRSSHLHVEGQCDYQAGGCVSFLGLELLGCISVYEFCCEPQKKSACPLPSLPHVHICWFPHHRD